MNIKNICVAGNTEKRGGRGGRVRQATTPDTAFFSRGEVRVAVRRRGSPLRLRPSGGAGSRTTSSLSRSRSSTRSPFFFLVLTLLVLFFSYFFVLILILILVSVWLGVGSRPGLVGGRTEGATFPMRPICPRPRPDLLLTESARTRLVAARCAVVGRLGSPEIGRAHV